MRRPMIVVGLLWAVACGGEPEEEQFIERASAESCSFTERCYLANYLDEYSDREDCIDEQIEANEDAADFFDDIGCDYEADKALECLDALRQAGNTCDDGDIEDFVEACAEVYDC